MNISVEACLLEDSPDGRERGLLPLNLRAKQNRYYVGNILTWALAPPRSPLVRVADSGPWLILRFRDRFRQSSRHRVEQMIHRPVQVANQRRSSRSQSRGAALPPPRLIPTACYRQSQSKPRTPDSACILRTSHRAKSRSYRLWQCSLLRLGPRERCRDRSRLPTCL